MTSFKQNFPYILGMPMLPAQRVIAIDVALPHVKLMLAQKFLNKITILRKDVIECPDYNDASEISRENLKEEIQKKISSYGHYPVAITLPQHLSLSQVIDLPPAAEADVKRMIQGEAHRIAGLSQTKIVWDYAPLRPYGKHAHSFWISLCQEQEVDRAIEKLGIEREEVREVMSIGNALICSYLRRFPETVSTVIVEIGTQSTTVAILYEGQGVYVTSFALGVELLSETISNPLVTDNSLSERTDIILKKNLFSGNDKSESYCAAIENWLHELLRIVGEWLSENMELRLSLQSFNFVLCGLGAAQPGLIEYLNKIAPDLHFMLWQDEDEAKKYPPGFFAAAEGVAFQALGVNKQSASLLPEDLRTMWRSQKIAHILQSVCVLLIAILIILLGIGTWKVVYEIRERAMVKSQIENGLEIANRLDLIKGQALKNYERIRPILYKKQFTMDAIQTLDLITTVRSNKPMWFVVFADDQTYFSAPPLITTNEPTQTNVVGIIGPTLPSSDQSATNRVVVKPGFVTEVCIPEEGEALRRSLSQLVNALKQYSRFKNVDTVPAEQRRLLADQRTILPEKHFAIFMEILTNEFQPVQQTNIITTSTMSGLSPENDSGRETSPVLPGALPVKR